MSESVLSVYLKGFYCGNSVIVNVRERETG